MKKELIVLACLLMSTLIVSQVPEKMSYQAIVRDADNQLVTSQTVGMQISVLQGGVSGTAVYIEIQTVTTNSNGLISIMIGEGSVLRGDISSIDWNSDTYFIKTETDLNGGTNYTISGTSQLLSVPYAFHAKTAESIRNLIITYSEIVGTPDLTNYDSDRTDDFSGDYNDLDNAPTIDGSETKIQAGGNVALSGTGTASDPYVVGSSYYVGQLLGTNGQEGVVVFVDHTGQHGLICSYNDIDGGSGVTWNHDVDITTGATSHYNGLANTNAIISIQGNEGTYGAKLCADYSTPGTSAGDWYLPSIDELSLIYQEKYKINKALGTNSFALTNYWSSTDYNLQEAWAFDFSTGTSNRDSESSNRRVRAVRAF